MYFPRQKSLSTFVGLRLVGVLVLLWVYCCMANSAMAPFSLHWGRHCTYAMALWLAKRIANKALLFFCKTKARGWIIAFE
jgi:hypothetical protein